MAQLAAVAVTEPAVRGRVGADGGRVAGHASDVNMVVAVGAAALACHRIGVEALDTESALLERYSRGERNFQGAVLRYTVLSEANLSGANLSNANFDGAILHGAVLSDANLSGANLSGAILDGANLSGANLIEATLTGARLKGVYLGHANLGHANLRGARLNGADFSDANLDGANLGSADLRGANLSNASLSNANLSNAHLRGANFHHATLGLTVLTSIDLGPIARGTIRHEAPSQIDWSAVVRSVGEPLLKDFLRRAGVPDVFVEYMVDCARSLEPGVVFSLLQSTFISYGGPDEAFARKLNEALERRGVTTFFFKDDAPPGERLHRVMRLGVNDHDRTILICSEASLQRPGLLNELEETLAREARDGGRTYLIPVRLDDYVLKAWAPANSDLAQTVRDRVISDFRRHEDAAEFDAEVAKLIAVLKKPVAPR